LKRQGNTLFANKSWKKASEKYTQALALDPKSSVLYSNRSACKLQSGRYGSFFERATELDPSYAKAWARLAAAYDALREYRESVVAWQKAIDCLPPENLSSMQASQRSQYQADLAAAQADFKRQK
ncbi:TPR-like protein, partial [Fistulina hepatica ATCC 64428]